MHEKTIEFVLFKEEFNQFLAILLAGQRRFNVEHGMLWRIDEQFFAEGEGG